MKLLDFKKWYENKGSNQTYVINDHGFEKLSSNIFRLPSKMLYIELDILSENVVSKNSKNKINRYLLNTNYESLSDNDHKIIKKILIEGRKKNNFFYLLGYDFTSSDPKKCFKNSLKMVENYRESVDFLKEIPIRGMGKIEKINEQYSSKISIGFLKKRIELVECYFDPALLDDKYEIPFYFNSNDYNLIEKYKGCLRGILIQSILKNESFSMTVSSSKQWPFSKNKKLTEDIKNKEDFSSIFEMKYPNPKLSSIVCPQNSPLITKNKITIMELTEKRAKSVSNYLNELSQGMMIHINNNGLGYKENSNMIEIEIKKDQNP